MQDDLAALKSRALRRSRREIVRTEHTEKLDLAEGDRERIAALEKEVAELSRRIDQLNENSAVALIPQDDGALAARVRQLEEVIEQLPALQKSIVEFGQIVLETTATQMELASRFSKLKAGAIHSSQAVDNIAAAVQQMAGRR